MSGFDPAWLDLREPVDHRSLAREPLHALVASFAGRESICVTDLACGSGSTLRALAPRLPPVQRWTLIDHDPVLLAHARERLAAWADAAEARDGRLAMRKGALRIDVSTERRDLAADPLPASAADADLVTAAALFDLVGREWLARFVERLACAGRPLYATMIYDGRKLFDPRHRLDDAVIEAFNRHQRSDKGFGPALGPDAGDALAALGAARGLSSLSGASPWLLGPGDAELMAKLVEGIAHAAAETADLPDGPTDWLAGRIAAARTGGGEVGHVDVLLTPTDPR